REVLARLERYELDVFAEEDAIAAQAAARTAEAHAAATGQAAASASAGSSAQSVEQSSSRTGVSSSEALEAATRRAGRRKALAQASLFDLANQKVIEEIRDVDPKRLSPKQAKELLRKLRQQMM